MAGSPDLEAKICSFCLGPKRSQELNIDLLKIECLLRGDLGVSEARRARAAPPLPRPPYEGALSTSRTAPSTGNPADWLCSLGRWDTVGPRVTQTVPIREPKSLHAECFWTEWWPELLPEVWPEWWPELWPETCCC